MSHIPRLGPDQLVDIFSNCTLPQLCRAGLVCREWFDLHSDDRFWKPVLNQLKPLSERVGQKGGGCMSVSSKLRVQGLLTSHRFMANAVARMIVNEDALNHILNQPPFSLKHFKEMPFICRSLEIWKGLSIDSTGLLKSLVDQVESVAMKNLCLQGRFFVDEMGLVHDSESVNIAKHIYTVMLLDFTKAPISRFNGAEVINHLQSVGTDPVAAFREVIDKVSAMMNDSHQKFPNLLAQPGS